MSQASVYSDFLSVLTGLSRGDYELIVISEFRSLIFPIVARSPDLKGCIVFYAGDNENVVTWATHRRPGNMVAKFFDRIPDRLENERGFTLVSMYISAPNNKLQGEMSRFGQSRSNRVRH